MVKISAVNPLSTKDFNLASPWTWVAGVLFVVFILIILGAGKWLLDKGKGITGIGAAEPGSMVDLLGGY